MTASFARKEAASNRGRFNQPKPSTSIYDRSNKPVLLRPLEPGQYTSAQFAEHAARLGIRRSVGRTGSCFDNALAESFNATLKVERANRTQYPTPEHARRDIARYIEFRYNRRRLHSALDYRTPQEAYDEYINHHETPTAA